MTIIGAWDVTQSGVMGTQTSVLIFRDEDGLIQGENASDPGVKIENVVVDGDHIRFDIKVSKPIRLKLPSEITLRGDTFVGTSKAPGIPAIELTGARRAEDAPIVAAPSVVLDRDVRIPMRDGITLRGDISRPGEEGQYPVLLMRHGYDPGDGTMYGIASGIAAQGYVVIIQNVRGRYGSEGDFDPFQPDIEDGYDSVEWAAAQPWSNGRVGMFGISYGGIAAREAAIAKPPHLVAIAPMSSPWDWEQGAFYWAPGIMHLGLAMSWSAMMTTHEAERRGIPSTLPANVRAQKLMDELGLIDAAAMAEAGKLEIESTLDLVSRRPLRDIPELKELAAWFRDWADHGTPGDPYWRRISASEHATELDYPVFNSAGWHDFFAKGTIDSFTTVRAVGPSEQARRGQRLVLGPWNHNSQQIRPDADPAVESIIMPTPTSPMMRFFNHYLKDPIPGYEEEKPVRVYVMGENAWREESDWPLPSTEWTSYYLHGADGRRSLSTTPPTDELPDEYVYDPDNPAPGSIRLGQTYGDGVDLQANADRPDVLVYETEPLASDVEITGPVMVELWASSSVSDTDFTAKLVEVFHDGTAVEVVLGIVRTSIGVTEPRTPGVPYRYEIDLRATGVLVKAGHRIRLDISSSEYPTFDLNPNTGETILTTSGATMPATQLIFHDRDHPSQLILPIIPR